jgi:hypothetical protein
MTITYFKTVFEKSTPFFKDVEYAFKRIKEGNSKELIKSIQNEKDEKAQKKLKEQLPVIRFAGQFRQNNDESLIKASGLIILDFDKYESEKEMYARKNDLCKDKYTFACFISPSGNGIKVLVKIPEANVETYKRYFEALADYYNDDHFDLKCSNISRACFESFDSEIYVNKDSELWDKMSEEKQFDYRDREPIIKLDNENDIVKRLMKWFTSKYSMAQGERNSNLFILASALSDYGVDEYQAVKICRQYESKNFTSKEIERTVSSAYKKCQVNFGMKYFEDYETIEIIKNSIKSGKTLAEVKKKHKNVNEDSFNKIKETSTINDFWEVENNRKITINNIGYKNWLQNNGFYKYYPDGSDTFIFVKKENNLVDNTNEFKIKDYVLNQLMINDKYNVYNFMASNPALFKDDRLNIVDAANIVFREDTVNEAYLYFRNGALKVTANDIKLIDYIDLNGYVWKKHIIDFDFYETTDKCDFNTFIEKISNGDNERWLSMCSTIGYLLHSYKTSAKNMAVILNDETISENPNGGTGKGIFINAISKIKRVSVIDGKTFSFDKSFPYQTVSADTQIIVFDDVRKNFNFENLFSVVTEGITIEKKNKDAIKLPIEKSPKVMISTNYSVGGEGNSFERRKWDVEFSQHYNKDHTPIHDFGKLLFDEWDNDEWMRFFNFMIGCLQFYLKNGLVKTEFKNIRERNFIKVTSFEFNEWVKEGNIKINERNYKNSLYESFIKEYEEMKKFCSQKRFAGWLEKYGNYINVEFEIGKDNLGRYIMYKSKTKEKTVEPEIKNKVTSKSNGLSLSSDEAKDFINFNDNLWNDI